MNFFHSANKWQFSDRITEELVDDIARGLDSNLKQGAVGKYIIRYNPVSDVDQVIMNIGLLLDTEVVSATIRYKYLFLQKSWTEHVKRMPQGHVNNLIKLTKKVLDKMGITVRASLVDAGKSIKILDKNTNETRENSGMGYGGAEDCYITEEHLKAISEGKVLSININGGEYVLFICTGKPEEERQYNEM